MGRCPPNYLPIAWGATGLIVLLAVLQSQKNDAKAKQEQKERSGM